MQNNYYKISVFINQEDNIYHAYCAELTGCHSQGESYADAQENIKEAVDLYLSTLTEPQAIECFGKTPEKIAASTFDIHLRLTAAQAEPLLLKAGFVPAGSKDKHRVYQKENLRFVLPLLNGQTLSPKITKELLDLVGA